MAGYEHDAEERGEETLRRWSENARTEPLSRTIRRARNVAAIVIAFRVGAEPETLFCPECGERHNSQRRLDVLRRTLPASKVQIRDASPHFWPSTYLGNKQLRRDLARLGAKADALGIWRLEVSADTERGERQ